MTREDLILTFGSGYIVRRPPALGQAPVAFGRGLLEADLEHQGYEKKTLKKLVKDGLLEKVTTTLNGGWRNTYVLLMSPEELK